MPGTPAELAALAASPDWPDDSLIPPITHQWADGTPISEDERDDLWALRIYLRRVRDRRRSAPAQRRAMRLLRSILTAEQCDQLGRLGYFYVRTPGGTTYRLDPRCGHAERVEWHGSRWFARRSYCLHDERDEDSMPPADVTIAHLLLLMSDEGEGEKEFLETANESRRDDQLWNGEYLRRMRRRHGLPGGREHAECARADDA